MPPPPPGTPVEGPTPAVVLWFRVYCGLMLAIAACLVTLGVLGMSIPELLEAPGETVAQVSGSVFGFALAVFAGLFASAFAIALLPRRGSAFWIYHVVVICLGALSGVGVPLAIPLLIGYAKKGVRDWYGA